MNKLNFEISEDKKPESFEIKKGDIVITNKNELLIVIQAGFGKDRELQFKLIHLGDSNRWSDMITSLYEIKKFVIENGFKVYRGNDLTVKTGERIF